MEEKADRKPPSFSDYFWTAISLELALRGLHPEMDTGMRNLVATRYGKRSLLWLPLDVVIRVGALRAAQYVKDMNVLSDVGGESIHGVKRGN